MKVGTISRNFSKACDTLSHRFLLAKLKAYDLQLTTVKQLENCLIDRLPRTKTSNSYISWFEIIASVPQGSIFVPLIFNIFSSDLFLYHKKHF